MSQAELLTAAGIIQEEAGKISAEELANEGISAEEMAQFSEAYAKLNGYIYGNTRSNNRPLACYTQKLADLFAEASAIKKNILDPLSRQYQRKSPRVLLCIKPHQRLSKRNTKESEEAKVEEASEVIKYFHVVGFFFGWVKRGNCKLFPFFNLNE